MANELTIFIDADTSGLQQGLAQAEREANNFQSRIQGIADVGQKMAGLGAVITAGLTVPIVALGKASITAYGEIQALQKGLESVAGSVSYAEKQFAELREVAKLPGIGLKEAVKGSINLQAIGFSADKAKETLLQFGNAIATVGKGRVEFDRAIYGISQLANTEFPLGEDLNIVADALPQVRTLLKDTFGKTRSDDLKAMGVTSKQVVDVILEGLGKLPRVSGGIKNAFENLGDAMQQNLARIGKLIDDRFDISSIIDKVTNGIDKLITAFEDLSPTTQKVILGVAGVTAVAGPLLLAVGGFLALLPTLTAGFTALAGILPAVASGFTALSAVILANPITAAIAGIALLGTAIYLYATKASDAEKKQESLNKALDKATINANKETAELKKLYSITQDQTKSIGDRNKAVDQIQKQYPAYFGNLSNEAILTGKAGDAYKQLTVDILSASRARAAQSELDKRSTERLEKEIDLRDKYRKATELYNKTDLTKNDVIKFNLGEVGLFGKRINTGFISDKKQLKIYIREYLKSLKDEFNQEALNAKREDVDLTNIIGLGANARKKLDQSGAEFADAVVTTGKKIKKAKEDYVYQKGSEGYYEAEIARLEELKKRAQFDSDVWRELSKQIETYQQLLNPSEIEPVKVKSAGFMDAFGNEYKTFVDFLSAETQRTNRILGTELPNSIANGIALAEIESLRIAELKEKLNESLNNLVNDSVVDGITDAFSSIGKALATGGDVFKALGQSLLGSFGKILSELGKQLIQYGVGLLAIKVAMKSLNPYVAIAAGAALVALGAGVTASVANQSNSIGGGGNSGVSTSTGSSVNQNFSSNYTNASGSGSSEVIFRISGPDLVGAFNRSVSAGDRVNAL